MENTLSLAEFLNTWNTLKCLCLVKLFDDGPHVVGIPVGKQTLSVSTRCSRRDGHWRRGIHPENNAG